MKVICRYGHFAFFPEDRTEVIRFQTLFGIPLVRENDYFTFEGLAGLPRWSQTLRPFGTLPAIVTCERRYPWEVMEANQFVYSLATGLLVPWASVAAMITTLPQTLDCCVAPKLLIQPGSLIGPLNWLFGYHGQIDLKWQKLYVYARETLL